MHDQEAVKTVKLQIPKEALELLVALGARNHSGVPGLDFKKPIRIELEYSPDRTEMSAQVRNYDGEEEEIHGKP